MPVYAEKKDKLTIDLGSVNSDVEVSFNSLQGTKGSLAIATDPGHPLSPGHTALLGKVNDLRGKTVRFVGAVHNPLGNHVGTECIIWVKTKKLEYRFPQDYTGTPRFTDTDQSTFFTFIINFK